MQSRLSLSLGVFLFAAIFLLPACRKKEGRVAGGDEFLRLSNVGKAQLDRGEAAPAVAAFEKALALNPDHPDAKLNLANAYLLAGEDAKARALAEAVLEQERGSAAALYVAGVTAVRQRDFTNAVKLLQQAKDIDIRVNAVSFQLGLAYEGLGNFDEALAQYEEIQQFEADFPGLHFRLSQTLQRLGRATDAAAQLQAHQQWLAKNTNANLSPAALARSKYTEARIPFQLEQPDREGIKVVFTDVTSEAFGGAKFTGPVGVIDFARNGTNHLLVRDGESFRVLLNQGGKFATNEQSFPFTNGGNYTRWLVADLNKDVVPDALVLGDRGVHLYRFATNGTAVETTAFAGLKDFAAVDGLFTDLNFRGDLDLVTRSANGELRVMSNLQNMYFVDTSTNAPALNGVRQLATEDWNNDETLDLFVSGTDGLTLLLKERGGSWTNETSGSGGRAATAWLRSAKPSTFAVGDMNNDLRPDLVSADSDRVAIFFNGSTNSTAFALRGFQTHELKLLDYDNDGWLDVFALGDGFRLFRNFGANGFHDVTAKVGLDEIQGRIDSLSAADLDNDCDTDLILNVSGTGLRLLRNDGGNKNQQLKVALQGTRSNSSGLGVRIDIAAGGLRVARRVHELPVEIGVGQHKQLDAVNPQWFELSPSYTEIVLTNCDPLRILELSLPTGSCPYLYTWDGERFQFASDFLCSAPLGLPVAPGKYIEADEDEIVWLGNEQIFKPKTSRNGAKENYVLQMTEELREVLYLDEAKLLVVDHPAGTEVHSTTKLLPGKSSAGFGKHELVTLRNRLLLRSAANEAGLDVANALAEIDQHFASPSRLREPQLRGLAEPHSVTVDFGELPVRKPLVLALTGWLRFGGGMANIAASSYSEFPFPFPTLEAEVNGQWQRVNVEMGAPSGRSKTILVDLANELPPGARTLRVTAAFEIHWDRIALFERAGEMETKITRLAPSSTDLHWRGYSEMTELHTRPADTSPSPLNGVRGGIGKRPTSTTGNAEGGVVRSPTLLVPDYTHVSSSPFWRITPSGWATRYGEVDELVAARDNAFVLVCGGDELTLEFAADQLAPKPAGMER
ncbi:MAG TPA: FG-GAP-like repeat-containing protein, partial [Methylomirabilota bacterium]|nr:FG-GAP-like repeat-containing protein [Methylomirabilota bacterium]